jgi:putative FmdB family regulatory protein
LVPVYQYACTECGEQLEVRQTFTDDALTVCPACEGRLRKVLHAVGVVFKGSGFYRTDSRAASSSKADSGTAPAGKNGKPASEGSAGSKAKDGSSSGETSSSSPSGSSAKAKERAA